ncbi:MAG: sulfotransferase [Bacteroidota bacterium]
MPHSAPLLLSSAVRRSGTTLVQRLLSSAPNCLIYGETCAYDLQFGLQVYLSKQLQFQVRAAQQDALLAKVLAGDANDWIADLMPPVADYLAAQKTHCLGVVDFLERYAVEQQRPVWGLKMAEWPVSQILQIQRFLPPTRLVYIHRDLLGCVRSARRVQLYTSLQELEYFCQTWHQNYRAVRSQFPAEQLLLIDYQALLEQPGPILAQLEAFSGARGIQAEVLHQRINTLKSDRQRAPKGDGYLPPTAELPEAERLLVDRYAALS